MLDKASVVSKANTIVSKCGTQFFTPRVMSAFVKLGQAYSISLTWHYVNLEYTIQIETDILGYLIEKILSQITLNGLSEWQLIALFS